MMQALRKSNQNYRAQKKRLVEAYRLDQTLKNPDDPELQKERLDTQMRGQLKKWKRDWFPSCWLAFLLCGIVAPENER